MIGVEKWNTLLAKGYLNRRLKISDNDIKYWISVYKLLGTPSLTYFFLKHSGQKVPRIQSTFYNLLRDLMTAPKYSQYTLTGKYTIKDMQIVADLMGRFYTGYPGECLSSKYKSTQQPLLWKCGRCGFEHYESFDSLRKNNFQSFCLKCFENYKIKGDLNLLDRYSEICKKIFLPHFYKREFFEASLGILEPLIIVFNKIFEYGVESEAIINGFSKNAPASDRIIEYTLLKAKEALLVGAITQEDYNGLFSAVSHYAPHIARVYQNDDHLSYYKRQEHIFERWFTSVPLNVITVNPNLYNQYHPRFFNPNIIRTQRELLYLEWGGRDLKSGKLFTEIVKKERTKQGLPPLSGNDLYEAALLLIDRHHYQIIRVRRGRITFMKRDCRLQALVPLTEVSHGEIRREAREWKRRFTEAKQAILKGELYIPSWWDIEDQIAFARYLRKEAGWRPFSYY